MEYYVQGDPKQADQIKSILVNAGYNLKVTCNDENLLYFTVKGKKDIQGCDINSTTADVIRSATESYKEIQLPKFKIGNVVQDNRCPEPSPEEILAIYPLLGYYRLVSNDGTIADIPFEYAHKYFDYYDEKETILPFEAGDLVLARDGDRNVWRVDIFSHLVSTGHYRFICSGDSYSQCIPFKDNKHLTGTSQKCCKHYPPICYGKT